MNFETSRFGVIRDSERGVLDILNEKLRDREYFRGYSEDWASNFTKISPNIYDPLCLCSVYLITVRHEQRALIKSFCVPLSPLKLPLHTSVLANNRQHPGWVVYTIFITQSLRHFRVWQYWRFGTIESTDHRHTRTSDSSLHRHTWNTEHTRHWLDSVYSPWVGLGGVGVGSGVEWLCVSSCVLFQYRIQSEWVSECDNFSYIAVRELNVVGKTDILQVWEPLSTDMPLTNLEILSINLGFEPTSSGAPEGVGPTVHRKLRRLCQHHIY